MTPLIRSTPQAGVPADDLAAITLAILAGGEGTRMGRPKAQLEIAGIPILRWMLDRLRWPGPTLLVTSPGREHPPGWDQFDREIADPVADQGPLRGIITALESSQTDRTIVAAVDMPLIAHQHLHWLANRKCSGGLLLQRNHRGRSQIEPLPLLAHRSILATLQDRLHRGEASVRGLAAEAVFSLAGAPADWEDRVWTNLNFPEDLAKFLQQAAHGEQ